jgi:hypothetical protein
VANATTYLKGNHTSSLPRHHSGDRRGEEVKEADGEGFGLEVRIPLQGAVLARQDITAVSREHQKAGASEKRIDRSVEADAATSLTGESYQFPCRGTTLETGAAKRRLLPQGAIEQERSTTSFSCEHPRREQSGKRERPWRRHDGSRLQL